MEKLPSLNNSQLYVSQIIDNLNDLAQYFGADTETIVNYAQRHFKAKHRQQEWLTVRAMLRHALGPNAHIEYAERGKPLLTFQFSNPSILQSFISLSHSKTHAALLLSASPNVGVDIESISERILKLAERIASPEELPDAFPSWQQTQRATFLTTLWTIKEAVYKSLDRQEHFDLLTDVRVNPSSVLTLPATADVMVKGIPSTTPVLCQLYRGNCIAATQ